MPENKNENPKSGGSNLAVSNPLLKERVQTDLEKFLKENPDIKKEDVPAELLTASGSGLDPHISVKSAVIQADRIAKANNVSKDKILNLINETKKGDLVNVLELNISLLNMKE